MTTTPSAVERAGAGCAEWMEGIVWPRLLRAPGLALRPERVGIGFFLLVLTALLAKVSDWWPDKEGAQTPGVIEYAAGRYGDALGAVWAAVLSGHIVGALRGLWDVAFTVPAEVFRQYPVTTLIFAPLLALVWTVGGGAISRMAASELSQGVLVRWPAALGFAVQRWLSLLGAVLGPLIVVGAIALGLAAAGWLLLSWPVLNVVGAVLYVVALGLSAVAVVVLIAYTLGFPMLVPAVACEGTDAIDAIERSYAFLFGRPLRLLAYLALLAVVGLLAVGLAFVVTGAVVEFARDATGAFAGAKAAAITGGDPGGLEGSTRWAAEIVEFWTGVVFMLAGAYAVSYVFSAATALYLVMRQVCSGQDIAELWMPGMVEGTMTEAMAGRATVSSAAMPAGNVGIADDE